jgi:hypothetical protein
MISFTNKLLFGTDNEGSIAWNMAAKRGLVEALQKSQEWAKENLTTEEINNRFLFGTDKEGRTSVT